MNEYKKALQNATLGDMHYLMQWQQKKCIREGRERILNNYIGSWS